MQLTLLALLSGAARGEERVLITGQLYTDSVGTLVATPVAQVDAELSESIAFSGRAVVNGISAASRSIDAVSSASPEYRGAGRAALSAERGSGRASGLVEHSVEPDYRSTTVGLGLSRDFASRCTTVDLYYWHSFDEISPNLAGQPAESLQKGTDSYRVTLTQVLTPTSLVSATYNISRVQGYQENPYYTDVVAQAEGASLYITDSAPDRRVRHAASARMAQWLPIRGALHPQLRLYSDDWGVRSVTGELSYAQHLGELLTLGLRYRYYQQSSSWFYQASWSAAEIFASDTHSLDIKFDALSSHLGGLRMSLELAGARRLLGPDLLDQIIAYGSYDRYQQQRGDALLTADVSQFGLSTIF